LDSHSRVKTNLAKRREAKAPVGERLKGQKLAVGPGDVQRAAQYIGPLVTGSLSMSASNQRRIDKQIVREVSSIATEVYLLVDPTQDNPTARRADGVVNIPINKKGKPSDTAKYPIGLGYKITYWGNKIPPYFVDNRIQSRMVKRVNKQSPTPVKRQYIATKGRVKGKEQWYGMGQKDAHHAKAQVSYHPYQGVYLAKPGDPRLVPVARVYANSALAAREQVHKKIKKVERVNQAMGMRVFNQWAGGNYLVIPRREWDKRHHSYNIPESFSEIDSSLGLFNDAVGTFGGIL